MQWYEGDIAEAVAISKTRNAIFVVYVEGKDDKSKSITSLINEDEISSKLQTDVFVAIKVEANSLPHTQFAAIYKNVPAPSIFFIGKTGKPISIILEPSTVADLSKQLDSIIQKHTGTTSPVLQQNTVSAANQSDELIKREQQSEKVPDKPVDTVCENGVCSKVTDNVASTSAETKKETTNVKEENEKFIEIEKKDTVEEEKQEVVDKENKEIIDEEKKELTKDEKLQRAKELMEKKREMKKQEEEDKEKEKELERRKMGQDVQKLRRWQQDEELKTIMEERQRAKKEEKAARERILAQIAQDKADRAVRFGTPAAPVTSTVPEPQRAAPSSTANTARLQFKMPDGSSHTHVFESGATLQEVRDYISSNLNLPYRNFTLSTTFPRREFTVDNNSDTLRDLELCPNAVILILSGHSIITTENGGFMSIVWLVLTPIFSIFGFFRNLIFGEPHNGDSEPAERTKKTEEAAEKHSPKMSTKRKMMEPTVIRRQGNSNIHRLSDRTDDDDENNTWNGNSTQQM